MRTQRKRGSRCGPTAAWVFLDGANQGFNISSGMDSLLVPTQGAQRLGRLPLPYAVLRSSQPPLPKTSWRAQPHNPLGAPYAPPKIRPASTLVPVPVKCRPQPFQSRVPLPVTRNLHDPSAPPPTASHRLIAPRAKHLAVSGPKPPILITTSRHKHCRTSQYR